MEKNRKQTHDAARGQHTPNSGRAECIIGERCSSVTSRRRYRRRRVSRNVPPSRGEFFAVACDWGMVFLRVGTHMGRRVPFSCSSRGLRKIPHLHHHQPPPTVERWSSSAALSVTHPHLTTHSPQEGGVSHHLSPLLTTTRFKVEGDGAPCSAVVPLVPFFFLFSFFVKNRLTKQSYYSYPPLSLSSPTHTHTRVRDD